MFTYTVLAVLLLAPVHGLDNGLGRTPPMGWNSWNFFACSINETVMRETTDAMVKTGLAAVGYTYVNVDDCWASSRDAQGHVQADPSTFPSGMKALADYVHSAGLRFGLYTDLGSKTCAGRPGSLGYEKVDAQSYASWAVDYVKVDNCNSEGIPPTTRYPVMRDALNATGRAIFFSMCEWGVDVPAVWAQSVGNSWRTTPDIKDNWASITSRLDLNDASHAYAAPGGFNDPDMLEVGNGGLTHDEEVAHFSLWALVKAPLLIGCDVRNMSAQTLEILSNKEVIAVSQDVLGVQGSKRRATDGGLEVWAGPLSNGRVAVVLFNRSEALATITATWSDVGLTQGTSVSVRDVWAHQDLGTAKDSVAYNVPAHGVKMVVLSPQ